MEQDNKWTAEMSSIPRINTEEYSNAYQNGFALVANKDKVFCHIINKFDNVVFQELKRSFQADSEFNILGVGVGKGQHEYHFLQTLSSHFKKITLDAVEPSSSMLQQFQDKVAKDDPSFGGAINCRLHPITLQEFIASYSETEGPKFNLITAVHSLYHVQDIKETIDQLLALTKENGIILIQIVSDCASLNQMKIQFSWTEEACRAHTRSDIVRITEGHTIVNYPLSLKLDVTELFDETSELGNNLLDFVTFTYQFRKQAPQAVVDDVVEFWRKMVEVDENSRKLASADEDLILVTKLG